MNHDTERQIDKVCAMAQLRITLAEILLDDTLQINGSFGGIHGDIKVLILRTRSFCCTSYCCTINLMRTKALNHKCTRAEMQK